MPKIQMMFSSRTFWTVVVTFIINGVAAIHNSIPPSIVPVVDGLLGILTIYFHTNPVVNFYQPQG